MNILQRYNDFYNLEMMSLPHGMAISMEHLQGITLECMVKAFARKYNYKENIPVEDILHLAKKIQEQGDVTVEKVSSAHKRKDLDAL
jgi:predicted site-specific integrase-resolvase